jgi:predicted dienelactone hydrolase
MPIRRSKLVATFIVAGAMLASASARADSEAIVPPIGPGQYAVGCSNFTQDFSRLAPGESAEEYWEGNPDGNRPRYAINLLADVDHSFYMSVSVPVDATLYGRYAGVGIDVVTLVCYPTSADNPRADYPLPNGTAIPHMQVDGESPLWPEQSRFPVLVFSHGLAGSPISDDYLQAIKVFASHGYVVVAPFHGDLRVADAKISSLSDLGYALLHFQDYVAMQALRPLELRAVLTAFLVHPDWRDHVDADRIGAFGASLGGESVMLMGGAQLTTTIGMSSKPVLYDPRIKAAVGYVPYFGVPLYPAFGRDQRGLDNVTLPYLALSGTADTTAPIGPTRVGMQRLHNTHQLVALQGVQHGFAPAFSDDIFTWALDFLDGQLLGDPVLRARSARMIVVAGGGDDRLEQDYIAPSPAAFDERIAVEYYNPSLDHYFFTAEPAEAAMLDAGIIVPGWLRTGFDFKVYPAFDARGLPACRFFGTPGIGPNSHFFTIDADECTKVKANPFWMFEGIAFNSDIPMIADCPSDRVPVVRMYNNGKGGEANHRYLTSHSEIGDMLGQGWIIEGPVFCALP